MKNYLSYLVSIISLAVSMSALASPAMPADHMAIPDDSQGRIYGKVVATMDTHNYTYAQIDTGSKKYWAAGPKTTLAKGSMIAITTSLPFKNFESKELKRKFDIVYFVNRFVTDKAGQTAGMSNPHARINMPAKDVSLKGIKKLKDGKTVAQVFSEKKVLSGKAVRVRGKVVKYTAKVMGKNWLHIQDSSGSKRLVVTTDQDVKLGDLVVVNGIVAVDQDLGYGYTYDVIVERAIVSVE